jgi:hypothetical protein
MATDNGMVQGYCGLAAVDTRQQIITDAQAHGTGSEQAQALHAERQDEGGRTTEALLSGARHREAGPQRIRRVMTMQRNAAVHDGAREGSGKSDPVGPAAHRDVAMRVWTPGAAACDVINGTFRH